MLSYRQQLHDLMHIDMHDGPVIFAGDSNAWHNQRQMLLEEFASHRGLHAWGSRMIGACACSSVAWTTCLSVT